MRSGCSPQWKENQNDQARQSERRSSTAENRKFATLVRCPMPFLQSERQSRVDPRCFVFLKATGFDSSLKTNPALKEAWLIRAFWAACKLA
jgi:hypothetical protein